MPCGSSSSSMAYSSSRTWQSRMMQQLMSVVCLLFLTHSSHARSVRRLCKNDIDLMSDEGVRIEPFERSHVELLLADQKVRNRNAIRFEFRTTGDNGMLFYGRHRHNGHNGGRQLELLALRLMGGDLYYKIHCSTVSADVLIPHPYNLNDGNWHSVVVRFRRGGMKTQIEVDGVRDSKIYEVSCRRMTSLVFGGVSPHDKHVIDRVLGPTAHYDGCIRRVNIPPALRSPPKYFAISVCEQ